MIQQSVVLSQSIVKSKIKLLNEDLDDEWD